MGFHESLTCLTVGGQDRVCVAESIWTEGGKSSLETTTAGPGCRTHTLCMMDIYTMMRYVRFIEVCTFCDCVVDLPELPEGTKNKLDKNHLPENHVLPSGFMNAAKVTSDKQFCSGFWARAWANYFSHGKQVWNEWTQPQMIDWFRKIGCVHSIKMCKWWGRERGIRQTMSHP